MTPIWSRVWARIAPLVALLLLLDAARARAIDFYEIQIYTVDTVLLDHLELELHSNSVTTATGQLAHENLPVYQIHETLEATYGITPHIEVGQYFATGKLGDGSYEYAGSRSKVHFGLPFSDDWPIRLGGNVELDYMRYQAEDNPLTLELRPILETDYRGLSLVANLAFEKPFEGPNHDMQFAPSGMITYQLLRWLDPGVEYYGDMSQITHLPAVEAQQHFIVPALNFDLLPRLELNLGVGFGLTRASNGTFIKSIVGWQF
ncbi:MAG TPA: hypothetical protein VFB15_07655 [Candidatus Binataceae bacterium]|nr:hypothetical protein [Candidatus Binataceae bacterium]